MKPPYNEYETGYRALVRQYGAPIAAAIALLAQGCASTDTAGQSRDAPSAPISEVRGREVDANAGDIGSILLPNFIEFRDTFYFKVKIQSFIN